MTTKMIDIDPRDIVVDWSKNISRAGEKSSQDSIIDLANDMLTSSKQISPIVVKQDQDNNDKYSLVVGYRRYEAALYLIENDICPDFKLQAIIRDIPDVDTTFINIAENLIREDPTPLQTAKALKILIDNGHELKDLCTRFGRSRGWADQKLALLELPEKIQDKVEDGTLPVASALEISKAGDEEEQNQIIDELEKEKEDADDKISVDEVKEKRREKGQNVKRNLGDVKRFLEKRLDPSELGSNVASLLLDYIDGVTGEDEALQMWDKITISIANMVMDEDEDE